ncbi:MAG: hypothetical protein KAR31_10545 [Candidatus Omnitrophica bacterium]|nr:hypothetical protein [Candidatus Omnitrophota bacterium]
MIKKKSVILMQGVFEPSVFDRLEKRKGKKFFILEGRPGLQAAKRSSRELIKRKITPTLIADNMAGFLFYKDLVKEVWLSYQQTDKKGAVCQVGGLILGVLGRTHNVPVYLHPSDQELQLLGHPKDITRFNGMNVAPSNIPGYVPLVEWVPKKYIGKIYGN